MGLVHTVVGAIALAIACAVIWGILLVLEVIAHSFSRGFLEIAGLVPLALIISYFLGGGIHDYRKMNKKA